jgi:peptidyl-dipeptidase Dcp
MLRLRTLTLSLLAAVAACGSSSKTTPVTTPPVATTDPAAATPHQAALAEVARLTAAADREPLLAPWTGPFDGVPPWDKLDVAAVPAAFAQAIALHAAEIAAIVADPAPPSFDNVIAAMENSGRHRDRVETLFAVMTSNLNDDAVQKVDLEWSPKLAAASDAIVFDEGLFARLTAVYEGRAAAGLSAAQLRLVELTYERFVKAGARLTAAEKATLGDINQQLAVKFAEFGNRVLADENTWIVLESEQDLAGLPDSLRAAYKAAADERGLAGKWAVVNTRSSVDPFLSSSTRRDLRKKVYEAFKNRGDNGGASDTNGLIVEIVGLRAQRAKLLGYATHAHWRMVHSMAGDPQRAQDLMMGVWPAAVARVREEVAAMETIARKEKGGIGAKGVLEPWDYLHYSEKVRKARYDLDQNELKPYFQLENMIAASFFMAEKLYGLTFKEISGTVPVFHPDVRVWEVRTTAGAYVGLFYGDNFARAGKRSGAWAMGYQGHETFTGRARTPITSNNNNFVRGAPGEPVLISLDDAETLFHEFGHALHGLLSNVAYPGLAGTPRDFVEYPSQVHEMWVLSRPVLDRFCRHVKTGEPMPAALLKKVEASSQFNQGYATVEYLSSAIVDMALHTRPEGITDADAFERDTLAALGAPRQVAMRHRLPQFLHLFSSDGYSAGYYSYLWSEVMDADTRLAFEETGDVFDPTLAARMKEFILAPGNTTDRADAYRQFRGRDPDVKALLVKRGFPTK